MRQPLIRTRIKLSDKQCSQSEVEEYYYALKSYFKDASENDFFTDKIKLIIEVDNRFPNPPLRDIDGRYPPKAEMFPFDLEIKLLKQNGLEVEMTVSYFWTLIVFLLFTLLPIFALWVSGDLLSARKFLLPFFISGATIYLGGMTVMKTISFRKQLKMIYKKLTQTSVT